MSQKVLCLNCFQHKSHRSFHSKTKRPPTDICITCSSISKEFETKPNFAKDLLLEEQIIELEDSKEIDSISIRREMGKFVAAYRAGHLESCQLYLGRASEALIYCLCNYLGLSPQLPQVNAIDKIEDSVKYLRRLSSEATLENSTSEASTKATKAAKTLVLAAMDIAIDFDGIGVKSGSGEPTPNLRHALKQICSWMKQHGTGEQTNNFESLVSEIMKERNKAAHTPHDGRRVTPRKIHVRAMHKKVEELFRFGCRVSSLRC